MQYEILRLILANVATARIGGLLALLLAGTNFNVSSDAGFLALFGVSLQTGWPATEMCPPKCTQIEGRCRGWSLLPKGHPVWINLLVSLVAVALGAFTAASPARAAMIWGSQRMSKLPPERQAGFVIWYRVFGILLCLGGALFALDTILP